MNNIVKMTALASAMALALTTGCSSNSNGVSSNKNKSPNKDVPTVKPELPDKPVEETKTLNRVVGPVSNAEITLTDARSQAQNIAQMNIVTDEKGEFVIKNLGVLDDGEYYLITASNGSLQDSDGDGKADSNITAKGSLNAIVKGSRLKKTGSHISILSNIAWEYVKQNYDNFSNNDIERRLGDIAKVLFLSDITQDGEIDNDDILSFDPNNSEHLKALAVDYEFLFLGEDDNPSLVDTYLQGDIDAMQEILDANLGSYLTRYPVKDSRSNEVKIEVLPFGKGNFSSVDNHIQYASDGSIQKLSHFYQKGEDTITVVANPDTDTEVLGWNGCNKISEDKLSCEIDTQTDKQVTVNFGYKEAKIVDNLVDLSLAQTSLDGDSTIYVTVNHKDEELVEKMQALQVDDYVVGIAEYGFLRKVVGVERISDYKYTLKTIEATLDEVILQGTGYFSNPILPSDIPESMFEDTIQPNRYRSQAQVSTITTTSKNKSTFSEIQGVRLIRPDNPNDKEFKVVVGNYSNNARNKDVRDTPDIEFSKGGEVTLFEQKTENGTLSVKAKGEVSFTLDNTFGMSFGYTGIDSITEVVELTTTEKLDVTVEGAISIQDACKKMGKSKDCTKIPLGSIKKPTVIMIGLLPVYIDNGINIYLGLDGKISASVEVGAELKQQLRAGFVWNKNTGFEGIGNIDFDNQLLLPNELKLEASLEPYVSLETVMLFYGYPGIALPKKAFLEVKVAPNTTRKKFYKSGLECQGGFDTSINMAGQMNAKFVFGGEQAKHNKLSKKIDDIFQSLDLKLFKVAVPIYKNNFGGTCQKIKQPARIGLQGSFINESVFKGDSVSREYVITNDGEEVLNWSLNYIKNSAIDISKVSGILQSGESESITVTIDTNKIEGFNEYNNFLEFINNSNDVSFDWNKGIVRLNDFLTGNTFRVIKVKPIPKTYDVETPHIESVKLVKPTIAQLTWRYPTDSRYFDEIDAFNVYLQDIDTNSEWELVQAIIDTDRRSIFIPNLLTNRNYKVAIDAQIEGSYSNPAIADLYVPYIEPEGDCQAFFTGAVVADHFDSAGISEAYVVDEYSEYVGAGLYPDNGQAFPKAVRSTFDGIAIAKGTKVTIWSDKNFKGNVLYERVGPAIINNNMWKDHSIYYPAITSEWKPELQMQFPLEVREWSDSNMHDWSYGSLKIECGY